MAQAVDLGLLKFLHSLRSSNIEVRWMLICPVTKMHPKRVEQILLKADIAQSREKPPAHIQTMNFLRKNRIFVFCKSFLLRFAIKLYALLNGVKVHYFNELYEGDEGAFEELTVVYSIEGILTEEVISKFGQGLMNIHPAVLPEYRGLDGGLWAFHESGDLGVSAYLIDSGIDTGPIVKVFSLDQSEALDSVYEYVDKIKQLKRDSYIDAIKTIKDGHFENKAPDIARNQNRGILPREIWIELENRTGNSE